MNCPICGAEGRESVMMPGTWRRYEVPYSTCTSCTVAFQNPMRTLDYANGEYRTIVNQKPGVAPSVLAGQERRAAAVMEYLRPRLSSVQRYLDIGSGAGILMRQMADEYKCQSIGVEVDHDYLEYSNEHGAPAGADWPDGPFDLVTIVHTLEHIQDPVGTLGQIRERLDGHLYIEVPTDEYDIVHPFIFNEKSLGRAIELAGLRADDMVVEKGDLRAWAE